MVFSGSLHVLGTVPPQIKPSESIDSFKRRPGEPPSWPKHLEKRKISCPCQELIPTLHIPQLSCYVDSAILAVFIRANQLWVWIFVKLFWTKLLNLFPHCTSCVRNSMKQEHLTCICLIYNWILSQHTEYPDLFVWFSVPPSKCQDLISNYIINALYIISVHYLPNRVMLDSLG